MALRLSLDKDVKREDIIKFLLPLAFEGLASLIFLLYIPSDPKNTWLLGFSPSRISAAVGLLISVSLFSTVSLYVWLNPARGEKLTSYLNDALRKSIVFSVAFYGSLGGMILGFTSLWELFFIPEVLGALWWRLTPLFVYGTLIFLHSFTLLYTRAWIPPAKTREWGATIILSLGFLLISWYFFPDTGTYPILRPHLFVLIPMWYVLAFIATPLILQLKVSWKGNSTMCVLVWGSLTMIIIVLGYFYVEGTLEHSTRLNNKPRLNDQGAYIDFSKKVYESRFTYTGDRNRMPLYPFLQAIFYNPTLSEEAYFNQGKMINILLSIVFLILYFIVFRNYLSLQSAFLLVLITAFALYIFKAAYFQVEITYYFFVFASFVLMSSMLVKPSYKLGLGTGVVLGIGQLLKASVLPGFLIFSGIYLVKTINKVFQFWKPEGRKPASILETKSFKFHFGSYFLAGLMFLGMLFPYLQESKRLYGSYFFNVNSSYYMWYDRAEDIRNAKEIFGYENGVLNLPPDKIPGPIKYVREHNISQILSRIIEGVQVQWRNIQRQYGMFHYPALFFFITVLYLGANLKEMVLLIRKYLNMIVFVAGYFIFYFLLFAWYSPIADESRFILSLFVPFMFSLLVLLKKAKETTPFVQIWDVKVRAERIMTAAYLMVFAMLVIDICFVLKDKLFFDRYGA